MACYRCGHKSTVCDDVTGGVSCAACGTIQKSDNFDSRKSCRTNEPEGVFVRIGTSGIGSSLNYKDKKIYEAGKVIHELTSKLTLNGQKVSEIRSMINRITEGEYGQGSWFPVLIGACAYIVVRNDGKFMSLLEVCDVVRCDEYELGRMVSRVVDHLGLRLPEVDVVGYFERVVKNWSTGGGRFGGVDEDTVDRMRKQGVFLLNCSVKWFLTTGRRPLPIVAAILVFVAELNGVEGVKIEEVAREFHSKVVTCRKRYKELLEVLVNVAKKILPWGKDVTLKNVMKNAPFVIRYMEIKSMGKGASGERGGLMNFGFDLEEVVSECLRKNILQYGFEEDSEGYDDFRYFELEKGGGFDGQDIGNADKLQLSHECLSMLYEKFSNIGSNTVAESGIISGRKRRRLFEASAMDWWNGKSELSKKLLLKQILEKDVGFSNMPPSFIKGCKANERRRAKINVAKLRINRTMQSQSMDSGNGEKVHLFVGPNTKKRKKHECTNDLSWEDFVIETLLLHQVNEEQIEKGQYNTLLDLYVFNSGIM